ARRDLDHAGARPVRHHPHARPVGGARPARPRRRLCLPGRGHHRRPGPSDPPAVDQRARGGQPRAGRRARLSGPGGRAMTYQIHRYPADLIDVVYLGHGERVVIRPVLPQDEDLTLAFFHGLSGSARYDRFMTSLREVPRDLMRRFTQVDYANHLALAAEVFGGGRETVVAEAWQGKGLARLLLGKLACRAGAQGVTRLTGQTLATNERMLTLARKAGFTLRPSGEVRGVIELEKWLPAPQPGRVCSGAGPSALAA